MPESPEEPQEPPNPSEDDRGYRWLGPAPTYVDHFTLGVFAGQRVVRLAFGEWVGRECPPIYRISVVLPISEARSLAASLAEELKEYDDGIAAKRAANEAKK